MPRGWVLGLPRGGVVVAAAVAAALGAQLEVLVARKLGAPFRPELAVGAIAEGGVRVVDRQALGHLRISEAQLEAVVARETVELERRVWRYRRERPLPRLRGRAAVLVDDGLATGLTARAAIRALRRLDPARVVLAIPVGSSDAVEALRLLVDEVVCLRRPRDLRAVGCWYEDFSQTTDEEVDRLVGSPSARHEPLPQ